MKFKKIIALVFVVVTISLGSTTLLHAQDTQNLIYTIKSGDTFYKLGERYQISYQDIITVNNASASTILYPSQKIIIPLTNHIIHTVQSGESYWIISQKYGVDINNILKMNNPTAPETLNVGELVIIPPLTNPPTQNIIYTVQSGDTLYKISQRFKVNLNSIFTSNNISSSTILTIGQKILIPYTASTTTPTPSPSPSSTPSPSPTPTSSVSPYIITSTTYTVQSGDTLWNIAIKVGLPLTELLSANNLTESSALSIGMILKVPVHTIPVQPTQGSQYGEYLDWWTQAQYVIPVNTVFKLTDFSTGKSFTVKRTTGAGHADCEPLTTQDSNIMKSIWGGAYSWTPRPVLVEYNGRKLAAASSSMPHSGNDAAPGGVYTDWRSDNYGPGYNLDWVKNNGFDGVFCLHFLNSVRHVDNKVDSTFQQDIKIAAGLNK